jgi:hypothetical protein
MHPIIKEAVILLRRIVETEDGVGAGSRQLLGT